MLVWTIAWSIVCSPSFCAAAGSLNKVNRNSGWGRMVLTLRLGLLTGVSAPGVGVSPCAGSTVICIQDRALLTWGLAPGHHPRPNTSLQATRVPVTFYSGLADRTEDSLYKDSQQRLALGQYLTRHNATFMDGYPLIYDECVRHARRAQQLAQPLKSRA